MKIILSAISFAAFGVAMVANATVPDEDVAQLNYETQGVKDVYYAGDNPARTIWHHIQAFASQNVESLITDYRSNSTLTFGPVAVSAGNTYEAAGIMQIKGTFSSFFNGGLPPFTIMTITSASRIGNQFYQTFDLNNGCIGSDTFLVTGTTISKQTAFVDCNNP